MKKNAGALRNLQHFVSIQHRNKCIAKLSSKLQSLDILNSVTVDSLNSSVCTGTCIECDCFSRQNEISIKRIILSEIRLWHSGIIALSGILTDTNKHSSMITADCCE